MSNRLIFISYSQEDQAWKDLLEKQLNGLLQLEGNIKVWTDQNIKAGEDWFEEIQEALENAWVAILLVSDNSLTSEFILKEEVTRLLKMRDEKKLQIVPIIVRDCPWKLYDWLQKMQVRPRSGRALEKMRKSSVRTELMNIVIEIAEIAKTEAPSGPDSHSDVPERPRAAIVPKPTGTGEQKSLEELVADRDRLNREISERESRSSLQGPATSGVSIGYQEDQAPSDGPSTGYQEASATSDPQTSVGFNKQIPEGGVNAKNE